MQTLNKNNIEKVIGYEFKRKELLREALTHSSFSNEQKVNKYGNYERLEFLGDAVLELVTSQYLFHHYPNMTEGEMTKQRATLVCEPSLAFCARDLSLGAYILLGKGEEQTGGRTRDSIIADVMEALIGAIFLDGGIEEAKKFINHYILSDLENKQLFYDSKTILQEKVQKTGDELQYELLEETGPEHDKVFRVAVRIDQIPVAEGIGKTKKEAEKNAAYNALLGRKSPQ